MLSTAMLVLLALAGSQAQKLNLMASEMEPAPMEPAPMQPEPMDKPCLNFAYDAYYDLEHGAGNIVSEYVTEVVPFKGDGCSRRGVLKLALASASEDISRRRVLVDLFFNGPSGYVFNLGDSSTNDGFGGDGGTQSRDAEVMGTGTAMTGYLSGHGNTATAFQLPQLYSTRLTLLVGDGHIAWLPNNNNLYNYYFNPNFYSLNGQNDNEGPVNYDLYLGVNRVVTSWSNRVGSGLCRVGIKFLPEF